MSTTWITVKRIALVAAALVTCMGSPAVGEQAALGEALLGPAQEPLLLFETEDCGPAGEAPCPTAADDSGAGAKPAGESATAELLPVGSRAKAFALSDPGGNPLGFDAETDGNPVLLVFWSLFCEPCKEELPYLDRVGREYAGKGLEVFTVNIDGENMARAADQYRIMNRFDFPVAMDRKTGKKYEAADAYGVTGTPSLFLIGRDGTVRWNHAGRLDPQVFQAELERLFGS